MKFRTILPACFFCLFCCSLLSGCSERKAVVLDKDDIRVAGFYCDYLILSGVEPGSGEGQVSSMDLVDLNQLLERHYLTRERMIQKLEAYKKNPRLWKLLLEQVHINIRNKETGGQ